MELSFNQVATVTKILNHMNEYEYKCIRHKTVIEFSDTYVLFAGEA